MKKVSIVTTMYYSAKYLHEFYNRVLKAAEISELNPEFIFVNDGSPDNSLEIALQMRDAYPGISVVELSRNFGHHKAIMAGLREANGDLIFLLDCDLEEQPELLIEFTRKLEETGSDVVFGIQNSRKGKFGERFFGQVFYKVFNHFAERRIPENITMSRLMTSAYVKELVRYDEQEFFLGATFMEVGFRQTPVYVDKKDKGSSTYSLRRKVALMVNAITSTSNKPLVYVFYFGALISFISFAFIVGLLIRHFFIQKLLTGWPSLIVSIWFLSGLIILCIGLLGIYMSKIYMETKHRPTVIVRKKYDAR
jgi:putative glycosyltransferase